MATPNQAAQDAEAAARANSPLQPIPGGETTLAAGPEGGDTGPQDPVSGAQPQQQQPAAPPADQPLKLVTKSPFDDKRAAIINKFRETRVQEANDATDDVTAFARDGGMPAEFQQMAGGEPEPAPAAEPEPAPAPAPAATPESQAQQKYKLIVNGQPVELTAEQVVAEAQKALAAGDILGQAKTLRDEIARIRDQALPTAEQPAAPAHQGPQALQPEQAPSQTDDAHQIDPLLAVVEKIQFGDPKEAAALLRDTIGQAVANATAPVVEAKLIEGRLKDESAQTKKVLQDFRDQNADLAKDPLASAAIERLMLDIQIEDLQKIGVDPAKMRPDGLPPTPGDIANAHRWFRTEQGFGSLRTPAQMLTDAKTKFLAWKGVRPEPEPDPNAPKGQPRVEVSVNRQERRQAVQPQPARTAAPQQRQPAQQPAQPRDRSEIVQQMRNRAAQQRRTAPLGA